MPFMSLNRRYRQLRRYRQIAEVFLRHGFGYLIEQLDLSHIIPLRRRVLPVEEESRLGSPGVRLRRALEELGPTFVKLGQLLSTRRDLVPPDIASELSLLQDRVETVPFDQIRLRVEEQLGQPLEKCFRVFDAEPVAAASIGQVHRAERFDGVEVAVKVRRPGIEEVVEVDLDILHDLAAMVEERFHPEMIRPRELVEEFARTLRMEMDYVREGRHMERFRRMFADEPRIHIPQVFWDQTTEQVLTMEFVRGVKITDLEALDRMGVDRAELANLGAWAFLYQVMFHGIFHGDPHPGNMFVEPGGTLAVLDFGQVGRLDEELMAALADLFMAIINRDSERIVQTLIRIGVTEGEVDRRRFKADMEALIDRYYGLTLRDLEVGPILSEALEIARRHRVRLPSDFALLGKAVLTVEGTGKLLYPDFNVLTIGEPFARELVARRWSPEAVVRRAARDLYQYGEMLAGIPDRLDKVLAAAQAGQLEIRYRHQGLEKLIHRIDVVGNRIAAGIVIASLVIGSSLIIQTGRGPLLWGVPMLGLLGFGCAALFGIWLVISILRSGRI